MSTDDAAAAVLAALGAPGGLYNVGDDRPLTRTEHVAALAEALGGDVAPAPPLDIELPPYAAMLARSQRVTSARFRDATGWRPTWPSPREGLPAAVAAL